MITITYQDVNEQERRLYELVGKREFDEALVLAHLVMAIMTKISLSDKTVRTHGDAANNCAFCLINVGSLNEAKSILEQIQDGDLIARVNLAFLVFLEKDCEASKIILNKIIRKKLGKDRIARYLHLAIDYVTLPLSNRIAEHVSLYNVAAWNLALINAQQKSEDTKIYSFLKKAQPAKNEKLIDQRVRYWVEYFRDNFDNSIEGARKLLNECQGIEYLANDVKKDIKNVKKDNKLYFNEKLSGNLIMS